MPLLSPLKSDRALFLALVLPVTSVLYFCATFFMQPVGRFRNWVFTFNNPPHALTPEVDLIGSPCTFLAWQLELGAEGTEHYQGYLELDRPCSLRQVLEMGNYMFLGAHFEVIYFAPKLSLSRAALEYMLLSGFSTTRSMLTFAPVPLWSWLIRQSCAATAAVAASSYSVPVFWSSACSPSTK